MLAIALPVAAMPYVIQQFGAPEFITQAIQADHARQKDAAGGVWCTSFNPDGSPKDIKYGAANCEGLPLRR